MLRNVQILELYFDVKTAIKLAILLSALRIFGVVTCENRARKHNYHFIEIECEIAIRHGVHSTIRFDDQFPFPLLSLI